MKTKIQLYDTQIRQDEQGRFCLNDLHQASGGESRHRPAYWLSNQQTQELIGEISKDGIPSILTKQGLGTFVSKELVYSYAMWISPKFHLHVIRTFDRAVTNQNSTALLPDFSDPVAAARAWADAKEGEQHALLDSKQKSEQIESMQSYFRHGMSAPQFVKGLNGVNSTQINAFLQQKNWLYKDQRGEWRVTSYARDVYMTEEANEFTPHGCDPIIKYKPTLLKKGAAKLYEWYAKGLLPMKATWNGEFTQDKVVGL
jgi:antirepressor protein 1|nr:MAG TPA: KilA-N domain [Caudoviricetes sp.]